MFSLGSTTITTTTRFLMRLRVVCSFEIKGVVVVEFDFIDFPSIEFDQPEANHGLTTGSGLFSPCAVWFFKRLEAFAVAAQDGAAFLLAVTLCPRGFDPDGETEVPRVGVVVTVGVVVGVEFHSRSGRRRRQRTLFGSVALSWEFIKQSIAIVEVVSRVVSHDWKVIVSVYNQLLAALRNLLDLKSQPGFVHFESS